MGIGRCTRVPKIRRWFNVSHDINSDPEVWELTDKFGVAGLRFWLEILSIGDRNEGLIPDRSHASLRALSLKCNSTVTRVSLMYDFCQTKTWIVCDPLPRLRNYLNFRPSRETKKGLIVSPPNTPNSPNPPNLLKNAAQGLVLLEKESGKLNAAIKAAADPIYQSNPEKFARLIAWIKDKEKRDYPAEVITAVLRLFWQQEQKGKIAEWWPYINRIFTKEYGRWNEEQAARHKAADSDFVRGLVQATAGVLKT